MPNFPNTPFVGQRENVDGRIWEWNGIFWAQVPNDSISNPNLASIAATAPTDGDILEYSSTTSEWTATKVARMLLLDGGNF